MQKCPRSDRVCPEPWTSNKEIAMNLKTILALLFVLAILGAIAIQYDFFMNSANNPFIQTAIVNTNSSYPDGPVWMNKALYYAEYSADRIVCRDGRGNTVFWKESGCGPRALARFNGTLLVACRDSASLVHLNLSGEAISRNPADRDGAPLERPIDMAPDSAGGLYFFTEDPVKKTKRTGGSIYYLDRKGAARKTGVSIRSAGGIALTGDGRSLLVSERDANIVLRYDVEAPGRLSGRRLFVRLSDVTAPPSDTGRDAGPDALAVDSGGTVFICHSGASRILLLSETGTLLQVIKTSLPYVNGIAFGRLDNVAYITAISSLREPPYNGAVFEFTRKRVRRPAP